MKRFYAILFIIIQLFIFTSCENYSSKPLDVEEFHMGTIITEKVYGKKAKSAADKVMRRIDEIEKSMTINQEGGEINKLNEMSGIEDSKLSKDTLYVLQQAEKYSQISSGSFDVTIGPLVKAWGVFTDNPRVPSQNEIKNLLKLVSYKDLEINTSNGTAKLKQQGQIVDLGGIAKGFAGDEAVKIYKEYGIKSALISLGGNVVTLGTKPDGSLWSVGVQNPRAENGKYIGILKVADKAVVSSGDYERYFMKDGIRYHHIIDPRSGYPADSGLIGTTIVADSSTDADALSTSLFVLGLDEGMKVVEKLNGVDAIFITKDKKVYTTSGLKEMFTFVDESKEFQYVEKR